MNPVRPHPGHPRKSNPDSGAVCKAPQLLVFELVPYPSQVCVTVPAVSLSTGPGHGAARQSEPLRYVSGGGCERRQLFNKHSSVGFSWREMQVTRIKCRDFLTVVAEEPQFDVAVCSKPFPSGSHAPTILFYGLPTCPLPVGRFSMFVVVRLRQ